MVLGGQFVSRINLNLREDKGFTYGARTAFDFRRLPGPFVAAGQRADGGDRAARSSESLGEIAGIRGPRPVTADELALGVAALTRGYARNFETAEQIARAAPQLALYDLPDDYFDAVRPADRARHDRRRHARRRRATSIPTRLTTLVVGDLDVIGRRSRRPRPRRAGRPLRRDLLIAFGELVSLVIGDRLLIANHELPDDQIP